MTVAELPAADDRCTHVVVCMQRGVKLFDVRDPGWAFLVDLKTFDMNDTERCVLAQRYGTEMAGCRALGIPFGGEAMVLYGFWRPSGRPWEPELWTRVWAIAVEHRVGVTRPYRRPEPKGIGQ